MGTWKPHRNPLPQQQQEFNKLLEALTVENEIHNVAFKSGQRITIAGVAWFYEEEEPTAED